MTSKVRKKTRLVLPLVLAAVAAIVPQSSGFGEEQAAQETGPTAVDRFAYDTIRALQIVTQGDALAAATTVGESATDNFLPELWGDSPDWLKRTEFQWQWNEDAKPDFSVLTVQPLFQTPGRRNTFFAQARLARTHQFGDGRLTTNFGVGYRRLLLDDTILAGVNGFFDREWEEGHDRLGAGAELKWNAFDLAFNYYEAVGGSAQVSSAITETPLDGYNVEFTTQIPYLPWARARFSLFNFFSKASSDDLNGYTTGLEMDLHQNVQLEFGFSDDDKSDRVAFVRLTMRLGDNLSTGPKGKYLISRNPIDDEAFRMRDMREHTLDKVRRIDTIIVERSSTGVVISRAN